MYQLLNSFGLVGITFPGRSQAGAPCDKNAAPFAFRNKIAIPDSSQCCRNVFLELGITLYFMKEIENDGLTLLRM